MKELAVALAMGTNSLGCTTHGSQQLAARIRQSASTLHWENVLSAQIQLPARARGAQGNEVGIGYRGTARAYCVLSRTGFAAMRLEHR